MRVLGVLFVLLGAPVVRADSVAPPAEEATHDVATPNADPPRVASPAPSSTPRKNPRMSCGCTAPRLLGRGPVVLDERGTVSAWLHDGARLEVFSQDLVNKQRLTAVDAPVLVEEFDDFGEGSTVPTTSRLVRARATAPLAAGTFLGVLRKSDLVPRDVVAVAGSGATERPAASAAPRIKALWLAPLERRDRAGCDAWLTHRLAFELEEGSPSPEAFLVRDRTGGGVALVDARHVGAFGLGLVEVCEQGLPLSPGVATELEVQPVSAGFGVGDVWRFSSDGTGNTDLARLAIPPGADAGRIADPFPVPGEEDLRGPGTKEVAAAVMGGVVGLAGLAALILWVVIPARRRRMKEIRCPGCGKDIPYDALDPKTDGFFCPACGSSGAWKGDAQLLPKVP